jgi:hypothetical protein
MCASSHVCLGLANDLILSGFPVATVHAVVKEDLRIILNVEVTQTIFQRKKIANGDFHLGRPTAAEID